jgi:mono/diheme cytochrome c family protein
MAQRVLNILLLVVLAACMVINWGAGRDASRPNAEFLPDMAHSPAYAAFAPNPSFRDGKTIQSPVPGTIVRGHLPLHYQATPEDALRAGAELKSPFAKDDVKSAERGAVLFASFCQHCHGAGGLGDGPVARRGFPPPPSLLAAHTLDMKDGQMFHVLTYGQGNMPSHAAQLSREDRWTVIAHVRALQAKAAESQSTAANQEATVPPAGAIQP